MAQQPTNEHGAAARLLHALQAADELSHEQAQSQLAALVEAEQAGEDVDALPEFALLLQHLDTCADCLALYEHLSADVAVLLDNASPLPAPALRPALAPLVARASNAAVRVLRGLRRRFELSVNVPRWQPAAAGEPQQRTLFSGTLDDLVDTPTVEVQLRQQDAHPILQVMVRDQNPDTRWRVLLTQGEHSFSAATDAQGVAQLGGFDAEAVRSAAHLDLLVSEEPA